MKKLFCIYCLGIIITLVPSLSHAQSEAVQHWSQPAAFIPSEKVSLFFDVSGTKLEGESKLCIHSWYPSDQTGRSNEELALTNVKENIWKFEMTPTEFYQMSADDIYSNGAFYGMLRTEDWSKADVYFTPDVEASQIQLYSLSNIKGSTVMSVFPTDFTMDKPTSILINARNTWSSNNTEECVQGELYNADRVVVHSGVNGWEYTTNSNEPRAELTKIEDGIWRLDMIINDYYELPVDYELEDINMVFASVDWKWQGIDSGCSDFRILAPDQPIPPAPNLYFFPLTISKEDILIITRENNDRGQQLSYSLTGGTKNITGNLEGSMTRQRAFIDINKEFSGLDISKITVRIIDQNDRTIYSGDIPFVEVDNLTK